MALPETASSLRDTRFRLDAEARIVGVNRGWDDFARENGAPELAGDAVVGRCLWDFVTGAETRDLYEHLFHTVRQRRRTLRLPFRCDSPSLRRFMEMRIAPRKAGELECVSTLLRTEARPAIPLFDAHAPRTGDFVQACSLCRRILDATGRWVEVERAVSSLDLFGSLRVPRLHHAVCPACHLEVRAALAACWRIGPEDV
jgi:hypothetical protein